MSTSEYALELTATEQALEERAGVVEWAILIYAMSMALLQSTTMWYVSTYLAYGVTLLFLIFIRFHRYTITPEAILTILLIAWLWVVSAGTPYPNVAKPAWAYYSKVLVMMIIVSMRVNSLAKIRAILKGVLVGGILISSSTVFYRRMMTRYSSRELGLSQEPNALGNIIIGTLIASVLLYPQVKKSWRILIIVGYGFLLVATMRTGSRQVLAVWAALAAGYVCTEHLRYLKRNAVKIIPVVLGIGIVVVLISTVFRDSPLGVRIFSDTSVSSEDRWKLIVASWNLFLEYPMMGIGCGCLRFHLWQVYTHTSYLDLLVEGGFIPLVLYLLMIAALWFRLSGLKRVYRHDDQLRKFLSGGQATVIAILAAGLFAPVHVSKLLTLLLGCLIGFSFRLKLAVQLEGYSEDVEDFEDYEEVEGEYAGESELAASE